jgi:wobble nucleotide-excising tRNase
VGAWSSFQVTAQSKISEAQQALRARLSKPSVQDVQRVEAAEQLTEQFIKQVDVYFSTEWSEYRTSVEAARLSWFK